MGFAALAFVACEEKEVAVLDGTVSLNISGLEDLGSDYVYEGWLITPSGPVTTGVFSVSGSGQLSKSSFTVAKTDIDAGNTFVLTIEPASDPDPSPSAVHILAGDFSGTSANLTVGHGAALANDFTSAAGQFILATPSTATMDDENSGIWWLDPSGPSPTLTLPTLPDGWAYEGWAFINGSPVSTGTFLSATGADSGEPFKGGMGPHHSQVKIS